MICKLGAGVLAAGALLAGPAFAQAGMTHARSGAMPQSGTYNAQTAGSDSGGMTKSFPRHGSTDKSMDRHGKTPHRANGDRPNGARPDADRSEPPRR